MSQQFTPDAQVVQQVASFRTKLWERYLAAIEREREESYPGNRNNFDSDCLSAEELEALDRRSIYEMWTDSKGRRHIRRF